MMSGGGATEKPIIVNFNSKLAAAASSFKANHTGVNIWIYDSYSAFTKVLDSPTTVSGGLGGELAAH